MKIIKKKILIIIIMMKKQKIIKEIKIINLVQIQAKEIKILLKRISSISIKRLEGIIKQILMILMNLKIIILEKQIANIKKYIILKIMMIMRMILIL